MIRLLLTRFWPALIPLALYVLWYLYRRHRAHKYGEAAVRLHEGPWVLALGATLALVILGFLWLGASRAENGPATYVPPHMENGKIVDGEVQHDDAHPQ